MTHDYETELELYVDVDAYKKHLIKKCSDLFDKELIRYKVVSERYGQFNLYAIGELKPCMYYYPYEAKLIVPSKNITIDPIHKEKVVALFRLHFKE